MKSDATRGGWVWAVFLTTLASLWSSQAVNAGTYERRVIGLEGIYRYPESREIPIDFGTAFASISRVEVELSGSNTNGWYDDPVLPDFSLRCSFLFSIGHYPWYNFPTRRQLQFESDGAFAIVLPIPPEGVAPNWSELLDGRTRIYAVHEVHLILGVYSGYIARTPYLEITNFLVRVEAEPVLKLRYNGATGELSWSAIPSNGRLQIHSAPTPDGPWEVVGEYTTGSPFPAAVSNTGSRFFKGVWVEDAAPATSDSSGKSGR